MAHRPTGRRGPSNRAGETTPRARSDILPGRSFPGNTGVNSNRDRAPNSSSSSTSASVSREAGQARNGARVDGKASHGVASKGLGLSLGATVRRMQESWEASRASTDKSLPGEAASRTSAANGHLGKRSSSGAFGELLQRKRRAVEDGRGASVQQGSSMATPSGSDEEASRRRSAPTAGMVNGASADKPQDGAQVLRAVRSAPKKPLSTALRGADAKVAASQILQRTASGRNYKKFDHKGKMISTGGALIPDGYELYDDDMTPFICPIRSCRKLFRHMIALGAHFGAGHRLVNLNDNGDGTLSIVGQFKAASGPITARIVSRKPLGPSEPPMATPKRPDHVKHVSSAARKDVSPASLLSGWSPTPSSPEPAPTPELGAKVMPYLHAVLPEDFNFGGFMTCKEGPLLLQQPVRRHATPKWIERISNLKDNSPRCLLAFLLFLTGTPAEEDCPSCLKSESGDECIVPSPSFPAFVVERFAGLCAACFRRCTRWRQKNRCLPRVDENSMSTAKSQATSFVGETMGAEDAVDDVRGDEAVGDETSPVARLGLPNSTSVSHIQQEPSPLRPPTRGLHTTSPTRGRQGGAAPGPLLNQGNLMSADVLEMEDWEIAPGTIRNPSDEPDNVAFSNAYLFANVAVPIAPGIGFNVITLKPGGSHKFSAKQLMRLCSIATGKLSVKMELESGDVGFQMGPNGALKLSPGTVASVLNRTYVDAVLHIFTYES